MRMILRRRIVLIPLCLVLVYAAYLAAGYWLAPGLIRGQAQDFVATKLAGKTLVLDGVRFNPLTLELDLDNFAVADTRSPAEPLVTVRHVAVNISASSLLHLSPRLQSLTIDEPRINAVLRQDGSLNLRELIPPDDGEPATPVWIGRLAVNNGAASFTDLRGAAPRQKMLGAITFVLNDFATTSGKRGGFNLDAASADGERYRWEGTLSMAPLASSGTFSIDALQLASVQRFVADQSPVAITGGVLNLAGDYTFAVPPSAAGTASKTQFEVHLSRLNAAGLALASAAGDKVVIASVSAAPVRFGLAAGDVSVGEVKLTDLQAARASGETARIGALSLTSTRYRVTGQIAEMGALTVNDISVAGRGKGAETLRLASLTVAPSSIDLTQSLVQAGMVTASGLEARGALGADNAFSIPGLYPLAPAGSRPPGGAAPSDTPAWRFGLAGLALNDGALRLTLASFQPARMLDIAQVQLSVGAVDDSLSAPVPFKFGARVAGTGIVSAVGRIDAGATGARVALDVSRLPLTELVAFGPPMPKLLVKSGALGAKGDLTLRIGGNGPPHIAFNGVADLAGLRLVERDGGRDLLSWRRLDVAGIDYRTEALKIDRITLDQPVSQISITPDARLNLATLTGSEAEATAPAASKPVGNVRVQAVMSNTLADAGHAMPVKIGRVVFKNGTIGFADYSIEPNFSASVQGFTGTITGLSSATGAQAEFDLKGYVIDRFSTVSITGRANPFAYDANTDIVASFKNIELPVFNPYSGQYAGYAIAKGKLDTQLHYKITNRQLDAGHHIVIDQLEWGEATDSKRKVSLPVRLATSMLKDRNGVIDLDLPVTGALDDPRFKIWPVVWQVVGNVLTKIVTAPFAMIGSLFEGADKAQFVAFAPGSAELAADAGGNLRALAKGLAERPEIRLDIPAGPGIREDAEAMTTARIESAALAAMKNPPSAYADLDDSARADMLRKVYKKSFGKGPDFPEDVPTPGMLAGKEAKEVGDTAQARWLEAALRPAFTPGDADLAALGQARADAVRQALLADGAIDPGRVFIATAASVAAKNGKVQMELKAK